MTDVIRAARRYLGVRFRHRGRKENALDCAGLVWIAYRDCGVLLPDFRLYGKEPHRDGLATHARAALGDECATAPVRRQQLLVGDVVVMRFDHEPHHLAIVSDYVLGGLALIHADGEQGRVVEHGLADDHVARITHVFRRHV